MCLCNAVDLNCLVCKDLHLTINLQGRFYHFHSRKEKLRCKEMAGLPMNKLVGSGRAEVCPNHPCSKGQVLSISRDSRASGMCRGKCSFVISSHCLISSQLSCLCFHGATASIRPKKPTISSKMCTSSYTWLIFHVQLRISRWTPVFLCLLFLCSSRLIQPHS